MDVRSWKAKGFVARPLRGLATVADSDQIRSFTSTAGNVCSLTGSCRWNALKPTAVIR